MVENAIKGKLLENLRSRFDLKEDKAGDCFYGEIYSDYRDEIDEKTAGEILKSEDPDTAFEEKLDSWYGDYEWRIKDDLCNEIQAKLENDKDNFPNGLSDEQKELVNSFIMDSVWFNYPRDHFLKQELCVNIMLDTGDGNYDYSLNSVYPCWYGRYGDRIDDKAGIVWLAKQQGYTKTKLWKALKDGDMADPKGFLESMRVELANLPSHMATVTFLVKMTFEQLLELNKALKWREKDGRCYDAREYPQCGHIVLGKETMCGLYDPWSGGGSVLEIQLKKDVRLPIKYIRCALPDEGGYPHEYSIGRVYGMCMSAWKNTVKEISLPRKLSEAC
ncbi:MAG: hypothetical protein IJI27_05355 [Oscillospiraceae bacterium]|nr:hypothetical protein [Oscillospiraceae bacterium]